MLSQPSRRDVVNVEEILKWTRESLTMGGYRSAWLADLVASCILDNAEANFRETECGGIFRDDRTSTLKGKKSKSEVSRWLRKFRRE